MTSSSVRLVAALFILPAAWGCGGSSPATPASAASALSPGNYTLRLTTGAAATGVGIEFNCRITAQDAPTSTTVGVTISGANGSWTGRSASGDLSISLAATSTVLTGTIGGTAPSTDGTITVTVGDNGQPAPVTGQSDASGVGGQVSGWVNLTASNGHQRGCALNTWNLAPR